MRWQVATALGASALLGATFMGCGDRGAPTGPATTDVAPTSSSAPNALALLAWSVEHRDVVAYRTLLTDDYSPICCPADSAGSQWRQAPCEDVLLRILLGNTCDPAVSKIHFALDKNFFVHPDPNYSWDRVGRWHKNIRSTITIRITAPDGSMTEIQGHANFFLVRGDSAAIPVARQDSTRWYLRRVDDEVGAGCWIGSRCP